MRLVLIGDPQQLGSEPWHGVFAQSTFIDNHSCAVMCWVLAVGVRCESKIWVPNPSRSNAPLAAIAATPSSLS